MNETISGVQNANVPTKAGGFWKNSNKPILLIALLYLEIAFIIWNLLGPLAVSITADIGLSSAQIGSIISVAILGGAILRLPAGGFSDAFGPRLAGLCSCFFLIAGLVIAWTVQPHSYLGMLFFALFLGVGGATFAIAIPLASGWHSKEFEGRALGIVGIGNSGMALTGFFAPELATYLDGVWGRAGWLNVAGFMVIPLSVMSVLYYFLAKNGPGYKPSFGLAKWGRIILRLDSWILMFFYAVSFGGFVGLAFFLTIYFHAQYGLSSSLAGLCAGMVSIVGALVRPFGGALADKIGGIPALIILFAVSCAIFVLIALDLPLALALLVFLIGMLALGLGNGAVFALVPLRFKEVGVATGLVGMAGGVGGAIFTEALGSIKHLTHSYGAGFLAFSAMSAVAVLVALYCVRAWGITIQNVHGENV